MGKKGSGKKGKEKGNATKTPACTCADFYKCSCGNRPERPSKGHKWDPESQQWTGKGHRQKGASGQVASASTRAIQTGAGTQLEQWQRLPTQLLAEIVRQQRRPPPKYKIRDSPKDTYLYRLILPDSKQADKDLFFVPAKPVGVDEQAKQEAALLGLLHLTPNHPHERKLPEPYRTTWVYAQESAKKQKNDTKNKTSTTVDQPAANQSQKGTKKAQASISLTMAKTYTSKADKKKQLDEKRRLKNARIRKHEAIRMANRNHPVYMSASIRRQIEALLRNESVNLQDNDDDDVVKELENMSDTQLYLEERLHSEGFTRKQARTAWQQCLKEEIEESQWDKLYEECLQWLLVHLDEDQLPEGFDPRGRTLDVISSTKGFKENDTSPSLGKWAKTLGITIQEALLVRKASASEREGDLETALWSMLYPEQRHETGSCELDMWNEELEALDAIFGAECQVEDSGGGLKHVSIVLADLDLTLHVLLKPGEYPSVPPIRIYVKGKWAHSVGAAVHCKLLEYATELSREEPMIFELHSQLQVLLQDPSALQSPLAAEAPQAARKDNETRRKANNASVTPNPAPQYNGVAKYSAPRQRRRETRPFWSRMPSNTPPATAFPRVRDSLAAVRRSLPAHKARSDFLEKLRDSKKTGRVVLVTGDTGCGKTTQIPQFILEELPSECKIVVAQPRRLAATGVASRVAEERGEPSAGKQSVGYVVRGDSALCENSRLVFCTTGILLRQLQSDDALNCITHIVVDEVHERQLDTDILLGLLKSILPSHPQLHVILMSATLDADRFAAYWGRNTPRMHIPGRTFPVEDFTLEDVLSLTGYIPPKNKKVRRKGGYSATKHSSPWNDSEKSDDEEAEDEEEPQMEADQLPKKTHDIPIDQLIERMDESDLDYELVAELVSALVCVKHASDDGSILIFMSGAPEISRAIDAIKLRTRHHSVLVYPLHGGLQSKEQQQVFTRAPRGITKIIVSTNVAETSITIPDCTIVIDSAKEKQSSYDPANRMPLLVERFASRASLKQRRGRAGRVRAGTCYKLISKKTLASLSEHGEPEIRRCALDQTLLSLLFLGVEKGSGEFLSTLLDPPSSASVKAATKSLCQIGATQQRDELQLTPLGVHLAGIPAPPTVGKLLVMGAILGCRNAALAMAAGMSLGRSPFLRIQSNRRPQGEKTIQSVKDERILDERAKVFETVGASDHALLAAVFKKYSETDAGGGKRKTVCDSLGLAFTAMRDMSQLVRQLDSSLQSLGFASSPESSRNEASWRVVRSCIVSALAPSQLVKVVRGATTYHETAEGAKEMKGKANELKLYIRSGDKLDERSRLSSHDSQERVFVHPSSANFSSGSYSCPWLVYHSMVRTSKPFLRDVTECNAYPLLLFGGSLDVRASQDTVVVDNWVQLSANARIGSLMGGLRQKVDSLLAQKIVDPHFDLASTPEIRLIIKLIMTDGTA